MSTIISLQGTDAIDTAVSMATINTDFANLNAGKEEVSNKSTDTTFSANSDTLYPSQKATKAYVDAFANPANTVYPVGSIYLSTVNTNPNILFGIGTWSAYGQGRVLIGAGTGTKVATISSVTSSVITATGLTNASNNEFQTGQAVVAGTTAGNLVATTTYYVIRVSNTTFSLATTLANAQNGVVKTLAGTESGTLTLTLTARTAGDTGGEENHAMSSTELLAHTHTTHGSNELYNPGGGGAALNNSWYSPGGSGSYGTNNTPIVGNTGGNAAMNAMQPFISVYMWLRTA